MHMKIVKIICIATMLLVGCGRNTSQTKTQESVQVDTTTLGSYVEEIKNRNLPSSWTASVRSEYTMTYSDQTLDTYILDGVLEVNGDTAHLSQHINGNGMSSELSGDYYDGRLYNTYNSVNYYEDMDFTNLKQAMLVPMDPYIYQQDDIQSISQDGNVYTIQLKSDRAKDIFLNRYDSYGLSNYDSLDVTDNQIVMTFDEDHHYVSEKAMFKTSIEMNGQQVEIKYESELNYLKFDETNVDISNQTKEAESAYVNFRDIDTSSIATTTVDDDSPESTTTDTLKKRLVSRLGYTQESDNTYSNTYNENEKYTIDFNNKTFTYSNRSIVYVYNWKGDVGTLGACQYNFQDDQKTSSCEDSTVDGIKQTKRYLQMELYYCGLSLDSLQAE